MSRDPAMSTAWCAEQDALLFRLWITEGLSASQCAGQMPHNRSRSAIIGRANRLGLKREGASSPRVAKPYPVRRAAIARRSTAHAPDGFGKPQYQERPQPASGPIDSPSAKVWTERAFGECAYPISGEGADTVSCANPCSGSYCPAHAAVMYVAGSASRSRASGKERYFALVQARGHVRSFEEWAAA
jgi:GcrA cell cycle regulator